MRPIVNMTEEDRATGMGISHKKLVKIARVVPEISPRTDRQTQTDALITILRNRCRGRSNNMIVYTLWNDALQAGTFRKDAHD